MTTHPDNTPLAVTAIVVAVLALSLGDALVKKFSVEFSLWQLFVLRSALALPMLLAIKPRAWLPRASVWVFARSLLLVTMWAAYYIALPRVALSVAAAVWYTTPLVIVLFAAVFTGERVGARAWCAVGVGFAGVLVMLRPAAGAFNFYALLPLASSVLYATATIVTRARCRDDDPVALAFALHLLFAVVGAVMSAAVWWWQPQLGGGGFVLGGWAALSAREWGVLTMLAACVAVGGIGGALAYQRGAPATVAPFDFAYLVFIALWGWLLLGETPDAAAVIGIVMITAAGVIVTRRSR